MSGIGIALVVLLVLAGGFVGRALAKRAPTGLRRKRDARFWIISILGAAVLFGLFQLADRLGGVVFGVFFAQAVVIALVVFEVRRNRR